jgi:serine/threonine-protein kinase
LVRDDAEPVRAQIVDGTLIAGRYRAQRMLGRGGMAVVHEVLDTSRNLSCALKRLTMPERPERRASAIALFEREFLTLSQLDHPRVVKVFDYGVDDDGPFYTMELVGGADVHKLVPLEWREACAIARDLCSVLALLHSRRMVYRDLGPRNVRYERGGSAKLIDFGAMIPMGPTRQLVGTPAFCAPETVHQQPLDGRTDLYALGVTLYFMLVGRVPYPARDFHQLREQWRMQPRRPADSLPGLPRALDQLIMDLIQLDPALRPANAAEVMERLSAIAELPPDEQLTVSQAYLSTPNLVGRDAELHAMRASLSRARGGHGASMLLQSAPGSGRSRLLAACALEARLLGTTVLWADASDALQGAYGVVRALGAQLFDAASEVALAAIAPHAGVLGHVLPDLRERIPGLQLAELAGDQLALQAQPALRRWVLEVATQRPLLIAVDDVHRADDQSAAFVALLAQEIGHHPIAIAASLELGAPASSHAAASARLLATTSRVVPVGPLAAESTRLLLGSVFGDVPNLEHLAHRLHAISSGNPRDVMQLAQHLVDNRVVRYRAGAWTVPDSFDPADLPSGMTQALSKRVAMLSTSARELARAMALSTELHAKFEECSVLLAGRTHVQLLSALDELLVAGVLRLEGDSYALSQPGWALALMDGVDAAELERLHLCLCELFGRRDDSFRVAQHLLRAGQVDRGLAALALYAVASRTQTFASADAYVALLRAQPRDWYETYRDALKLCQERGVAASTVYAISSRLAGLTSVLMKGSDAIPPLVEQLSRASGLDLYAALDPTLPARERLELALAQAKQRYEATDAGERTVDPGTAIRQLSQTIIQAVGTIAQSNDYALLRRLPSLEPFYPIAPGLAVVDRLAAGNAARLTGRFEQAREIYRELLERLAQPDRAGLDASHHQHTLTGIQYALGTMEAAMGLGCSLHWAEQLQGHRLHQVNSVLLRMLHHLWQGDTRTADRLRREAELLRIQSTERQAGAGIHLLPEIVAHCLASDLTGVKQMLEALELQAQRYPAWVSVLHYARGEFHRIRGDYPSALAELERALGSEPVCHQIWAQIAGAHVRVLLELGRLEDARGFGVHYLASADRQRLGYLRNYLRMPLSLVQAALGQKEIAAALAQAAIDDFQAVGSTGLNLVVAYETRARVAVRARDQRMFERYAELCAQQISAGTSRTLLANYERVVQEARAAGLIVSAEVADAAEVDMCSSADTIVSSMIDSCVSPADRARASLELLLRTSGCNAGLLFSVTHSGPVLAARAGELEPTHELESLVRDYVTAQMQREAETKDETETAMKTSAEPASAAWKGPTGERLHPVLLCHAVEAGCAVTGVAVLRTEGAFRHPAQVASRLSKATAADGNAAELVVVE